MAQPLNTMSLSRGRLRPPYPWLSIFALLVLCGHTIKIDSDEGNLIVLADDVLVRNPLNASNTTLLLAEISTLKQTVSLQQDQIASLNASLSTSIAASASTAAAMFSLVSQLSAQLAAPKYVYVMGGLNIGGSALGSPNLNTVERYDPSQDTWTTVAPLPTLRGGFACAAIAGQFYVTSGAPSFSNQCNKYDPTINAWSKIPNVLGLGSDLLAGTALNGNFYAMGGWPGPGMIGNLPTAQYYSPASNNWTYIANMSGPDGLQNAAATTLDGSIYVLGGAYTNSVNKYNSLSNTWTAVTSMNSIRIYFAAVTLNGFIYALGGSQGDLSVSQRSVERYDPVLQQWSFVANMTVPRLGLSAAAIDRYIFAMGGYNSASGSTERYDPATNTWVLVANMTVPRSGSCGVAL